MRQLVMVPLTVTQLEQLRILAAGTAHVLENRPLLTPTITGGTVRATQTKAYCKRLEALAKILEQQAVAAAK